MVVMDEEMTILSAAESQHPKIRRSQSRAFLSEDGMPQPIEYFLASDPSAVIEHTRRVLYLEDDDIAHIHEGGLSVFGLSFPRASHPSIATRRGHVVHSNHSDAGNGIGCHHEGLIRPFYAKGNF